MPNTLADNLRRLKATVPAIGNAIIAKGGTVNAGDGLEEFPDDINTIPTANLTTLNVTENGTYYESTSTEITSTSFPITLNDSLGTNLLDYLISGNMSQTGTPTPSAPITPSECGERTKNLFDKDNVVFSGFYPHADTGAVVNTSSGKFLSIIVPCEPNTTYTWSFDKTLTDLRNRVAGYSAYPTVGMACTFLDRDTESPSGSTRTVQKFTTTENTHWLILMVTGTGQTAETLTEDVAENAQLEIGSEMTSYEPYGYKIPISSAGQTNNIYLGNVQTTRYVKKLVLDGTESWKIDATNNIFFYVNRLVDNVRQINGFCTHFRCFVVTSSNTSNGVVVTSNGAVRLRYSEYNTVDDFKSFLAQQYANGTPVTVWYVLATPETAVVNEPLRKIDDYADTISYEQAGVQIPTNRGNTVIDVDTTLKPSEMYIKYDQPSEYAGYNIVNVNVQTSFTPSDEGKVVSNGALVAQTPLSQDITQNGTYDTTLNNSITVNVSGGAVMPDRYLTVDLLNENNEPKKISIYGAPGDVFNWFFTGSSGTANSFGEVEEIVLDEDFASIGQTYTFRNCDKLTTINLPSQITEIPAYTFVGCSSLVSGFDLTNIETIGSYAFSECSSLDINADLSKVATIPTNAFSFCENLTTVKITNLTTSIGSRAFYDCRKMNGDIDLSNVTDLADASFQHCNSIDKPLDVSKVKNIQGYTFDGCKKVPSITLKNDFTLQSSSAKRAFANCESLTSIQQPTTWPSNTVPEGTYSGCINLEQSFDLTGATSIGTEAFMDCKKMLNPTVGTISTLGTRAFSGCSSITEFNFNTGSTVKTISDEAFKDCTSLALITFAQDSQITSFNKYAFANTKITSMTPPATLNAIGERCFEDCADLVEVDLSGTVYNPGNYQLNSYIFHNCVNLTTVKFPATLEAQIGSYNFSNCPKLLSINCPNGIKRLAQYAFAESSIEEIPQLTTAVTTLSTGCFKDSGLKNAVIPGQIATIQSYCFAGCTKLTSVTFHEAKNIALASSMFSGCTALDEIVIPSNVSIPADTFTQGDYEGGVKRVYIKGTSASKLNQYSFRGNTSITDVYFQWSQPSDTQSRYGLRAEATIHYDWDPDAV